MGIFRPIGRVSRCAVLAAFMGGVGFGTAEARPDTGSEGFSVSSAMIARADGRGERPLVVRMRHRRDRRERAVGGGARGVTPAARAGEVRVRVLRDGRPMDRVPIRIVLDDGTIRAVSGPDLVLPVPIGTVRIEAETDGFRGQIELDVVEGEQVVEVALEALPSARIRFDVAMPTAQLQRTLAYSMGPEGLGFLEPVPYRVGAELELTAGRWLLVASTSDGLSWSKVIEVIPGEARRITVIPGRGRVWHLDQRLLLTDKLRFGGRRSKLLRESVSILEEFASFLLLNPSMGRVEIGAHTDDVGGEEANRLLSEERAQAVRDVLVDIGVPAERLVAIGYGETRPMTSNGSPEGRAANHRVEFQVLGHSP